MPTSWQLSKTAEYVTRAIHCHGELLTNLLLAQHYLELAIDQVKERQERGDSAEAAANGAPITERLPSP